MRVMIIILFLLFSHEDPSWYTKTLAEYEAFHKRIKTGVNTIETAEFNQGKVKCYKYKDWEFYKILSDSTKCNSFSESVFFNKRQLLLYEVTETIKAKSKEGKYVWSNNIYFLNKDDIGILKSKKLIINDSILSYSDSLLINRESSVKVKMNQAQVKEVLSRVKILMDKNNCRFN